MTSYEQKLSTLLRQAKQGASLGLSDELQDLAGNAVAYPLLKAMHATGRTSVDPDFLQMVKDARRSSQAELSQDWHDSPITSFAGQMAGTAPLMLGQAGLRAAAAAPKALTALPGASRIASLSGRTANALAEFNTGLQNWAATGGRLARAAKGGAVGAGYGGAAGVGGAGDTPGERTVGGLLGAFLGFGLGGSAGALSRGQPTVSNVAPRVAKEVGRNPAEREFVRQLALRPDLPAMQQRALAGQQAAGRVGIDLTLPELLAQTEVDPLLAQQRILANNPSTTGAAQSIIERRFGNMQQPGQVARSIGSVAADLSPGTYDDLAQGLIGKSGEAAKRITAQLVDEAAPLYREAYQANKSMQSPELDRILATETGTKALREARIILENEGKSLGIPDKELTEIARELNIKSRGGVAAGLKLETYDLVKRALQRMSKSAWSNTETARNARSIDTLSGDLIKELDRLDVTAVTGPNSVRPDGGAFARARDVYNDQPEMLLMRQRIGNVANIDPLRPDTVVKNLYSGSTGTAKMAADALGNDSRSAAAIYLQDMLNGLKQGNLPPKPDAETMQMLRAYAGENSPQIDDLLGTIEKARSGNRYLYGSQTTPLAETGGRMAENAAGAVIDAATGNGKGLARRAIDLVSGSAKQAAEERYSNDLLNVFTGPRGLDLLNEAVASQGKNLSRPGSSSVAIPSSNAFSRPVASALASPRDYAPTNAIIPATTSAGSQALPPGFVIMDQQKNGRLPPGFTIMGRQ